MTRVHLRLEYNYEKPALCGKQSIPYELITTYLRYPNLNDFPYTSKTNRKWCPDCANHPEVVMARLNETNV